MEKTYNNEEKFNIYLNYIDSSNKINEREKKIIKNNLRNIIIHTKRNNDKIFLADEFDIFMFKYIQSYYEKEIFSKNLKELMNYRQLNVSELATKLNLPYSTVNDWVNGVSYPRADKLNRLAEALGVTKRDLIDPSSKDNDKDVKGKKIPVLGKIPAGIPIEAIEDILDYEEIPKEWLTGDKDFFALKLKGDSMTPLYLSR